MNDNVIPVEPSVPRRAHREVADGYLGGVASGLAAHFGVPVLAVRAFFVVTAALNGVGIVLYAAMWLLLPAATPAVDDLPPGLSAAQRDGRRPTGRRDVRRVGVGVALAALALAVVWGLQYVFSGAVLFWPAVLAIGGGALIWRQADQAQRERWRDVTARVDPMRLLVGQRGWVDYAQIALGLALMAGALLLFVLRSGHLDGVGDMLIAALLGVVGLSITLGPWIFRLASDFSNERTERIRSQERADVAAHVHDSVLQTLALIQRSAADPAVVTSLARAQERDLRNWLFVTPVSQGMLATAVRDLAAEVEGNHSVAIEVVTVGDTVVTERISTLLQATREAITNAARHSGAARVDVYVEVAATQVMIYVKDRGCGFDPDAVAADRQGIRQSIEARMRRIGGTGAVSSTIDEGTEVRLCTPIGEAP